MPSVADLRVAAVRRAALDATAEVTVLDKRGEEGAAIVIAVEGAPGEPTPPRGAGVLAGAGAAVAAMPQVLQ